MLGDPSGRRQLALTVRTAALDAVAPEDPHGHSVRDLLAPLDLADVPADGRRGPRRRHLGGPARSAPMRTNLASRVAGSGRSGESGPVNLHDWIDELCDVLDIETEVDEALVLDLARSAAHNVTKVAAPVTTYLLGVAAGSQDADPEAIERARRQGPDARRPLGPARGRARPRRRRRRGPRRQRGRPQRRRASRTSAGRRRRRQRAAPRSSRSATCPTPSPGPARCWSTSPRPPSTAPTSCSGRGSTRHRPGASDVIGLECSGTVAALGDGVDGWSVGDEVCALLAGGGYAERVVVPAGQLMPVPAGVDLVTAAALPEVACTVWSNVFMVAGLRPGEHFLVHGGAGGIGTMAIQLAHALGARVLRHRGVGREARGLRRPRRRRGDQLPRGRLRRGRQARERRPRRRRHPRQHGRRRTSPATSTRSRPRAGSW